MRLYYNIDCVCVFVTERESERKRKRKEKEREMSLPGQLRCIRLMCWHCEQL